MGVLTAIRFDLRRAPFSPASEADLYRECLAMARFADEVGIPSITIPEHHGVDFVASPTTLAGLILGATQRAHVLVNALLVPLHDPVRLAEAVATLDVTSGGRFTLVAGLGYRHEEFEMAGVDRSRRGALVEEHVELMIRAWSGEPVEWQERTIVVRPVPTSPPARLVWMGGAVRRSAERAARLRLPMFTMASDPEPLRAIYEEECAKVGFTKGFFSHPRGPLFLHVSEDPEADWERIAPYAVYDATTYRAWQTGDHDNAAITDGDTAAELRASGQWVVATPDEVLELARRDGLVSLHPLMGGMPPELGWSSLRLFAEQVLPHL
ncbi:MAG TPA: LLM class flavin-dependent oxidoreductase [Acidimicrobiales bacterium]|nr:LLM class flavin-dependent oxidoreductase [Acidimicrobiales bacterium]